VTVSIVVPAYNNAGFIESTMRSILAQTHTDLEIVVADHGSTDGTLDRLQQFAGDPRVSILTTEAGGGAVRNWNRVSEAATGEFVKLVCGDDIIEPTMVQRQLALFDDGVALVASSRSIVDADEKVIIRNRGLGGLEGRHTGDAATRATVRSGTNLFGEPACVMMRRDALASAGFWSPTESYLIDEATYVSVLEHGDFVGVREPLAKFRVNGEQWSVRLAKQQAAQAIAFHNRLKSQRPGLLSSADVALGNARARANALARRALYVVLGRRMRRAKSAA
jgi:glycosyltransferase involved in cell wall biosynthesis